MKLDHIGIAVDSIEKSSQFYKALGVTEVKIEEVKSEQVKVGFIRMDNDVDIELLEATSNESAIFKFIKKRGTGIHHVCFQVADVKEKISELKKAGVRLINDEPKIGAHNRLIAFVHPSSTGGVLIELSQKVEC